MRSDSELRIIAQGSTCLHCGATPGNDCITASGKKAYTPHNVRLGRKWGQVDHRPVDPLLAEVDRLRDDLADARRMAEKIAEEIDKRSYVLRSDPLHSDQFVAGMTYARNIARGFALGATKIAASSAGGHRPGGQ